MSADAPMNCKPSERLRVVQPCQCPNSVTKVNHSGRVYSRKVRTTARKHDGRGTAGTAGRGCHPHRE